MSKGSSEAQGELQGGRIEFQLRDKDMEESQRPFPSCDSTRQMLARVSGRLVSVGTAMCCRSSGADVITLESKKSSQDLPARHGSATAGSCQATPTLGKCGAVDCCGAIACKPPARKTRARSVRTPVPVALFPNLAWRPILIQSEARCPAVASVDCGFGVLERAKRPLHATRPRTSAAGVLYPRAVITSSTSSPSSLQNHDEHRAFPAPDCMQDFAELEITE